MFNVGLTHAAGVGDGDGTGGVIVTVIFIFGLQQYNPFVHCAPGFVAEGGVSQSSGFKHCCGLEHFSIGAIVGVGVGAAEQDTHWLPTYRKS
jgi:hypothetical protein